MPYYVIYDPATRVIKRWVLCTPENVRRAFGDGELAAWIDSVPPLLGRRQKLFNPETREITDGNEIEPASDT